MNRALSWWIWWLYVAVCMKCCVAFWGAQVPVSSSVGSNPRTSLHFNRGDNDEVSSTNIPPDTFWQRLKRFLPGVKQAKLDKTYAIPQTHAFNRYHIRLLRPERSDKRHCITRILRFFPDIRWDTAETIVDTAIIDGRALIRATSSKVRHLVVSDRVIFI